MTENSTRQPKNVLEILVTRTLNNEANVPVSWEQIDEEVARRKAAIAEKNQFEQDIFDLWYDNTLKASNAKLN